ncbi:hypothetical protein C7S20_07600 [Christiangramia fulva]|uniref:DUF4440 domain-containing protein n=1 Tax=Christiangramia fulva TaxID=2126553 RepID=A0A2R3Z4E7_9FLAO|nr:hypothetical protein [Christiangramia fulva]AVR45146.1 hypothetical protein C7S20_07600 [Christiangramia fulva]
MKKQELIDTEIENLTLDLIKHGTTFDLDYLEMVYDDELVFVQMTRDKKIVRFGKKDNMDFFRNLKYSGSEPLNDYSEFHYADNDGKKGFVILTRKMKKGGEEDEFLFNIYWEKKNGNWKIIRESVLQK